MEGGNDMSSGDGTIDFSGYSLQQLYDLRGLLDRAAFPQNFANLLAEIERRESAPATGSAPADPAPAASTPTMLGRFTRHDGWRGWMQALRQR